jgi:kinetochore protein Spc25
MDISLQLHASLASFEAHSIGPYLSGVDASLEVQEREVESTRANFVKETSQRLAEIQSLHALHEQQQQEAAEEQARTKELEEAVTALELQAKESLPAQLGALEQQLAASAAAKNKLAAEVAAVEAKHAREQHTLGLGVALFRRVLGVEFEAVAGQLHVRYAFINPAAGDALTHSLALLVDKQTRAYVVTACSPSLPSVPVLLAELNASGNFARFISRLRREFVKQQQQLQGPKQI